MYGDVVRGLPIPSGSAQGVYASHVLEHLSLEDFRLALRETFRILAPGGIFRLVVPDLKSRASHYLDLASQGVANASLEFMQETLLGRATTPRSLSSKIRATFGGSAHHWMWDATSMRAELEQVGFCDIRAAGFGDSGDPMFERVEDRERFYWRPSTGTGSDTPECALEAKRPSTAEIKA